MSEQEDKLQFSEMNLPANRCSVLLGIKLLGLAVWTPAVVPEWCQEGSFDEADQSLHEVKHCLQKCHKYQSLITCWLTEKYHY